MAKDKPPDPAAQPAETPRPADISPGAAKLVLPADVVRAAIHRRITLRDALPDDGEFKKRWRFLWEWLSFKEVSDTHEKDRATLICKIAEGSWSVAITDPSMAASMAVTGPTLFEAFERLDEALGDPDAAWVPSRKKEAKVKERRKR